MPVLSTEKCLLRPWHPDDEQRLSLLANDPKVAYFLSETFPFPYSVEAARAWIAFSTKEKPVIHFCIEHQGGIVGGIGLKRFPGVFSRTAEIGYWLGTAYWGKGIATQATGLMVAYAFQEPNLQLNRLEAGFFSGNPASGKVLEKNGFRFEGIKRQALYKHGQFWDDHFYGLLKEEWEKY